MPPLRYEDRMLEIIQAIGRLTGLHVVWKNPSGQGEGDLPLHVYSHCNPFCLAVKATSGGVERCSRDDNNTSAQRAIDTRRPFLKTCHAGVTELVVPLFDGDRFDGLIFLGPVREPDAVCRVRAAAAAFDALPAFDGDIMAAAETVLQGLAGEMAARKRGLRLEQAERQALDPRIAKAVEIIKRDLHRPLRATELAATCYLSTSRFLHLFKDQLGVPYSDYLCGLRIERAKELLTHTDLSMSRIAVDTGFANQNYFATVFRRQTDSAPSHYRRRTRASSTP